MITRRLLHAFQHTFPRLAMQQGCNLYFECRGCGHRSVEKLPSAGYAPVDRNWLERRDLEPPRPPQGWSGVPKCR